MYYSLKLFILIVLAKWIAFAGVVSLLISIYCILYLYNIIKLILLCVLYLLKFVNLIVYILSIYCIIIQA